MSRPRQRGFALVAVLWMLAALAALASAYSTFAVNTAASVYLPQQKLRLDAALRAAVELTAYRQLSWPKERRPSSGGFSTRISDARIDVVYRAETARIDLNDAPREMLAGLFVALGAKQGVADAVTDRIVAWRAPLNPQTQEAETAIYGKAGLSYHPVGAPFDNVLELALLPGLSPELLARALPYLTVYSGADKINPLIAEPVVTSSMPGMTPKAASALRSAALEMQSRASGSRDLAGPFADFASIDPNESVRAEIIVTFPDGRRSAEIVLQLTDDAAEPYKIRYWRDDFNGPR